ncbi:MAG: NAD-dependent epimerase/dehydratase family protein [Candidatus Eremiobacteraeota bacterium]|nr:NAD-dependent epimerase/dehydratase family protein [Candidatus Eremiobacteraeota bacterium]MBV9646112.1 NAD-dependent epimerase/dehydratase family protein [Candidatus Eremiobacteraeota bacterium]
MRLLVTGATGFLGRRVVRDLAIRGHHVSAFLRSTSDAAPIREYVGKTVVGSITDPLAMVRAADSSDAVIHLATQHGTRGSHDSDLFRTNVAGTRVTAEAVKTAAVPFLLHVSSVAAVGYSTDGRPIDERHENNFVPLQLRYHESRRLAEEEASDVRRYGVRVVIVNPAVLCGPCRLRGSFGEAVFVRVSGMVRWNPTGGICVVDVDDAARGVVAALERGRDGERYILGGENVTYADLYRRAGAAAGLQYRGRPLQGTLLHGLATLNEAWGYMRKNPVSFGFAEATLAPLFLWYSSAKAERELQFSPRPLEAILQQLILGYRRDGLLPNSTLQATS